MPPESNDSLDNHLERAVHALDDLKQDMRQDAFFIYSAANTHRDGRNVVDPIRIMHDLNAAGVKW